MRKFLKDVLQIFIVFVLFFLSIMVFRMNEVIKQERQWASVAYEAGFSDALGEVSTDLIRTFSRRCPSRVIQGSLEISGSGIKLEDTLVITSGPGPAVHISGNDNTLETFKVFGSVMGAQISESTKVEYEGVGGERDEQN